MLYPSINEIRKKADSRYTLVIMAAKRARDIVNKKPIITRNGTIDKPVSIAAQEIAEDLVTYKSAARVAEEKEKAVEATDENTVDESVFSEAEAMSGNEDSESCDFHADSEVEETL